ncbi:nuclear transport factor 2 family protein [Nocardia sp. NPDC058518]|uniref:nuclear transport factor 2 family protein n=1 Tax=Nocardia sp. NPDC058518 TaxID=3346534 RepID=UPI003647873A
MTTTQTRVSRSETFTAALQAHDLAGISGTLAPGVVFHSPVLGKLKFIGPAEAVRVFGAFFDGITDDEYTSGFEGAQGARVVQGRAMAKRRPIDLMMLLDFDEQNLFRDIKVFVRPLAGLGAVAAIMAPRLAAPKGNVAVATARVLAAPVKGVTGMVDVVAPWLVSHRS